MSGEESDPPLGRVYDPENGECVAKIHTKEALHDFENSAYWNVEKNGEQSEGGQ